MIAGVAPQNIEVEESMLGAMLVADAALAAVLDVGLEPADFYLDRHAAIFGCIRRLREASAPVDPLIAADALTADERRAVEAAGGNAAHGASSRSSWTSSFETAASGSPAASGKDS